LKKAAKIFFRLEADTLKSMTFKDEEIFIGESKISEKTKTDIVSNLEKELKSPASDIEEFREKASKSKNMMQLTRAFVDSMNEPLLEDIAKTGSDRKLLIGLMEFMQKKENANDKIHVDGRISKAEAPELASYITKNLAFSKKQPGRTDL
jgi:hypothetical protein